MLPQRSIKCSFKIFIDGSHGTTGLELAERLKKIPAINLLTVPDSLRKDEKAKAEIYAQADLVVLCLPDRDSARAVKVIEKIWAKRGSGHPKVLDTSTQFRTHPDWVYGHPQLWAEKIRHAHRVANPGCYAIGFITIVYPLIKEKLLSPRQTLTVFGGSGYSGGGRQMIEDYHSSHHSGNPPFLPYALDLTHKHLPEMKQVCGLHLSPLFLPLVGSYYRGMLVMVPLPYSQIKDKTISPKAVDKFLKKFYRHFYKPHRGSPITVKLIEETELYKDKFLSPIVDHDGLEIIISSRKDGDTLLFARLDNLGKGASGNALENIGLMLGM